MQRRQESSPKLMEEKALSEVRPAEPTHAAEAKEPGRTGRLPQAECALSPKSLPDTPGPRKESSIRRHSETMGSGISSAAGASSLWLPR